MTEDIEDAEQFCPLCQAGVNSSEHHTTCVEPGYAEDGEPVTAKALQLAHEGRRPPRADQLGLATPPPPELDPRAENHGEQPGDTFTMECLICGQVFTGNSVAYLSALADEHSRIEHPVMDLPGLEDNPVIGEIELTIPPVEGEG